MMPRTTPLYLILLLQFACAVDAQSTDHGHDISKIFGQIEIGEGDMVGDVDLINGGITLSDNSSANEVKTVNGSVRIQDDVTVHSLSTVNGDIRAGHNLKVKGDVSSVNGRIDMQAGTVIGAKVSTINGTIRLEKTEVQRNVETVNGDIRLSQGSLVAGDVIFHEISPHPGHHNKMSRLIVDADSVITGSIHLYREVELEIDENAAVGEIVKHY